MFYKRIARNEFHWHGCSRVPNDVRADSKWKVLRSRPSGEGCDHCLKLDMRHNMEHGNDSCENLNRPFHSRSGDV